jgi:hypothetical protein
LTLPDTPTGNPQGPARTRAQRNDGRRRVHGSRAARVRHPRLAVAALVVALLLSLAVVAVYGTGAKRPARRAGPSALTSTPGQPRGAPPTPAAARIAPPPPPPLVVSVPAHAARSWTVVALTHGHPAVWLAQRSGVTLVRFEQSFVHLTLHAGTSDGGAGGWTYGNRITPREVHRLIAAVNGGFKLNYADVGFMSGHHVAVALKAGLASIVTYTDGRTDIGAWREGVPRGRSPVFSVLQNQHLLVDRGVAAASVSTCILACWGETIGSRTSVARSGLGITADGQLVWGAGEQLLPAELASALIKAGAVRALELDINPDWVAGYLYVHHRGGPAPVPLVPGQLGITGKLLEPDSRDFLAFVAK